jgi:hypothetical protein
MQPPILPIFVSAALALTAYVTLVQFAPFKVDNGQNQHDTNLLRVEDYLLKPDRDTVLAGSSLTFRLPLSLLGDGIANIAITAESPVTDLALVALSDSKPKLVLVEINQLSLDANMSMVESELRFPNWQLRKNLRAFRSGYDPANLSGRALQALFKKGDADLVPPPDAIRKLIAERREIMRIPPDREKLRRNLTQVASLVKMLQDRGTRVGFYEMPIDASLTDLPAQAVLRREVLLKFPPDRFCWLALGVRGGIRTIDGIHAATEDAASIAKKVRDQHTKCLKS